MYGLSSGALTFINKSIYTKFGFQSPLDLFVIQAAWNIVICTLMMGYKSMNPKAFLFLERVGMRIPSF